ncbi:hypothetical protein DYY67_2080 [Candidatus Nitrosotalea sp. TS]|uniref:hypothetical protein n=1 Tax=Candidatus Nitrosotalea sp. TS TaxID=2341020 RepID=UPI001408B417|nr:hypothetical protein [Candidatus Nitrosotalea sp. TS]NHI04508.1 hypothetical protein [Candidatus Nitrosotalea sp. TS]
MKLKIPTKYFAICGGSIAVIAVICIVLINYHGLSPSESVSLQHADSKLLEIYDSIPTQTGKNVFMNQSKGLTKSVDPELVDLDSQIISCSASVDSLLTSSPNIGGSCTGPGVSLDNISGKYLGGQCCGILQNTTEYHEHLEKLQQYSNIPDIPLNPYKTAVYTAKKWIDYDSKTTLSASEQTVYEQAMKISGEGPCCCHCWHYYVNEGVAKKLIHDYKYNAKQVADFWNVSDICGV